MSNQESNNNSNTSCFYEILKVIDLLQRNVEKIEDIDGGCTKPFLGGCSNFSCYNTRPVTFYTCNNDLLTISYQDSSSNTQGTSSVFRVESLDDNCCKVRLLIPNPNQQEVSRAYIATNQFATINLKCVCVLQCLPDIIIDCL